MLLFIFCDYNIKYFGLFKETSRKFSVIKHTTHMGNKLLNTNLTITTKELAEGTAYTGEGSSTRCR